MLRFYCHCKYSIVSVRGLAHFADVFLSYTYILFVIWIFKCSNGMSSTRLPSTKCNYAMTAAPVLLKGGEPFILYTDAYNLGHLGLVQSTARL